jgi:cytochrome P450
MSRYATSDAERETLKPMDLASKIQYLTLDVISHVGLGEAFGDLAHDKDINSYLEASEIGLRISNMSFGLGTSWLREVPVLGSFMGGPSEKDETGFGRMLAEARKSIAARLSKTTDEKPDMLTSFIRHGLEGDDLFSEVFETILAGSDTTASAIRGVLLFVMTHPRVHRKLQAEIDEAVHHGKAPASPGIISDSEARNLRYLSAVVREGMRIHPPVANLFSRVVPDAGDIVTIDDKEYFLPGGTMIGYSAWGMQRTNTSVYGPDAAVFRPERWLVDESIAEENEKLERMKKTNDMIFGYGRWSCVGKVVAQIEIHKAVFEVLRHFELALTNPHQPWNLYNCMGLHAINDMWVEVTPRGGK